MREGREAPGGLGGGLASSPHPSAFSKGKGTAFFQKLLNGFAEFRGMVEEGERRGGRERRRRRYSGSSWGSGKTFVST